MRRLSRTFMKQIKWLYDIYIHISWYAAWSLVDITESNPHRKISPNFKEVSQCSLYQASHLVTPHNSFLLFCASSPFFSCYALSCSFCSSCSFCFQDGVPGGDTGPAQRRYPGRHWGPSDEQKLSISSDENFHHIVGRTCILFLLLFISPSS